MVFRTSATFTLLPRANVVPVAVSPGGPCITFNRTHRLVSFQSLPIGVAGTFGRGRFALFGGPHAFETGPLGFLVLKRKPGETISVEQINAIQEELDQEELQRAIHPRRK